MCRIVISFFPLGQALVHGEALVADEGVFLRPRRGKSESHHSGIPENQNPIKLPTHNKPEQIRKELELNKGKGKPTARMILHGFYRGTHTNMIVL